ncbi:U6 snRNA-associated Sm-like protein LSm2 [Cucumispora dikerogammari]|nr:U6 snRNA-associated Sm-like protein LSm2 [Cucumispora dikerogammari]
MFQNSDPMLFYTIFEQYINKEIVIELKNDTEIKGILLDLDIFLNLKLSVRGYKGPEELRNINTVFVRGSHIKFIHLTMTNEFAEKVTEAARYRFVLMNKFDEK